MMDLVQVGRVLEIRLGELLQEHPCPWGEWGEWHLKDFRKQVNDRYYHAPFILCEVPFKCGCKLASTVGFSDEESANNTEQQLVNLLGMRAECAVIGLSEEYERHSFPAVNKAEHVARKHAYTHDDENYEAERAACAKCAALGAAVTKAERLYAKHREKRNE